MSSLPPLVGTNSPKGTGPYLPAPYLPIIPTTRPPILLAQQEVVPLLLECGPAPGPLRSVDYDGSDLLFVNSGVLRPGGFHFCAMEEASHSVRKPTKYLETRGVKKPKLATWRCPAKN